MIDYKGDLVSITPLDFFNCCGNAYKDIRYIFKSPVIVKLLGGEEICRVRKWCASTNIPVSMKKNGSIKGYEASDMILIDDYFNIEYKGNAQNSFFKKPENLIKQGFPHTEFFKVAGRKFTIFNDYLYLSSAYVRLGFKGILAYDKLVKFDTPEWIIAGDKPIIETIENIEFYYSQYEGNSFFPISFKLSEIFDIRYSGNWKDSIISQKGKS